MSNTDYSLCLKESQKKQTPISRSRDKRFFLFLSSAKAEFDSPVSVSAKAEFSSPVSVSAKAEFDSPVSFSAKAVLDPKIAVRHSW